MLRLELPLLAGHYTAGLVRNIDAGLVADANRVGIARNRVDAELVGERVVEGVAGIRQSAVDVDHAVVLVTGEEVPVESGSAVARDVHVLRGVLLEARERHDDLERRARRELRLDGLVHQRMVRVRNDGLPVGVAEANSKLVGVEGGPRNHSEDLAGMRVHRDNRTGLALERSLGSL